MSASHGPPRRRTAEEIFRDWEQEDRDMQLRVYTDYKLPLGSLLRSLEHLADDQTPLKQLMEVQPPFRPIQHLTLAQVRRVQQLQQPAFIWSN